MKKFIRIRDGEGDTLNLYIYISSKRKLILNVWKTIGCDTFLALG